MTPVNQFTMHFRKSPVKQSLTLVQGDITDQITDVIVNAANENLHLGVGVAGAILRKGGSTIQDECNRIGFTPVGHIAITSGGKIPVKYIFHAVGPRYHEYPDLQAKLLLRSTIRFSFKKMIELDLTSITFPAISTGIFGFPLRSAAECIIDEIFQSFLQYTSPFETQICLFREDDFNQFLDVLVVISRLFTEKLEIS